MLQGLEAFGNWCELEDHVNGSKLSIPVEENFGLQNPIEVLKIHQIEIRSDMEFICNKKKCVRQIEED